MKLAITRAIIDAIHHGVLLDAPTQRDPIFGLDSIGEIPGIPRELLHPRNTWRDPCAFDATAQRLASLFQENFRRFEAEASPEVRAAGPVEDPRTSGAR
jgi:phosphoenolpyruvate carboxykinase (ATP)